MERIYIVGRGGWDRVFIKFLVFLVFVCVCVYERGGEVELEVEEMEGASEIVWFAFERAETFIFLRPIAILEAGDDTLTDGVVKETRAEDEESDIVRGIGDESVIDKDVSGENELTSEFRIALNDERARFGGAPFGGEG
jgi:hypothetical protein